MPSLGRQHCTECGLRVIRVFRLQPLHCRHWVEDVGLRLKCDIQLRPFKFCIPRQAVVVRSLPGVPGGASLLLAIRSLYGQDGNVTFPLVARGQAMPRYSLSISKYTRLALPGCSSTALFSALYGPRSNERIATPMSCKSSTARRMWARNVLR